MKSVAREVAIQPLGGLVPCNFNLNIDVIFWYLISSLFFDEKLYQILSHFGEKSKFWTFSEKLDLSSSTDPTHWSCIQSEINCWNIISKQLTRHNSAAFISKIHFVKTHPISNAVFYGRLPFLPYFKKKSPHHYETHDLKQVAV